ncbi:ABC-F family ATP-binding cassette domain-containing protein [Halobacillus locisalis]|uniref:ABC-F family ATP-binding cassette domain-containing protein n=1 Tax=Halobacillus locisalis TaxID=220753 RepID=A0A838CRW9_9BACI|nr:ATP-binding cassette domain-containing protein [Halobacillus locisalis]MBA2174618.1 ABC-F family ATP-binding cassette domain-containing protein [Halobacillus locisalis]
MLLMKAINIDYSIADRTLLKIPELSIHKGDRIGLVGKNGQGKTLLLHYLLGELEGSPQVDWWTQVSWLKQLEGRKDKGKSGGEQTLERLDQIFKENHPLLFLDEPTNNLDWNHIEQLEHQLSTHEGAYVVVSHDRMLLDHVCDQIWELDQGKLTVYNGDYSFYEHAKEQEKRQQQKKYEQYIQEKKRLEERARQKNDQSKKMRKPPKRMGNSEWQLGKNKAATKQGKVERVSKTLEQRLQRLEKVEKPFEWHQVNMGDGQTEEVHSKVLAILKDEIVQAGHKRLFQIDHATIETSKKIALIGANGSGKTTLVHHMLNKKDSLFKKGIEIGYFNQNVESLPEEEGVYHFVSKDSPLQESTIRMILARLSFNEEDMNKRIAVLSGGERVKLALARLLTRKAHMLILDEPTNHLDIEAAKALEELVRAYPGTILFVSHDRTFVDRTADHLWVVENQELTHFSGTLKEWQEPKPRQTDEYDQLTLQNRLTELISRISVLSPGEDKEELERQYQVTLQQLKESK